HTAVGSSGRGKPCTARSRGSSTRARRSSGGSSPGSRSRAITRSSWTHRRFRRSSRSSRGRTSPSTCERSRPSGTGSTRSGACSSIRSPSPARAGDRSSRISWKPPDVPIPALAPSFPVLLAAAVSLAGPLPPAEVVVREGEGIPAFDRRIDALLAAGDFLLVTRDTLIARQDTVPRSVLVLDASLILEGDVAGDLLAVGANVFLRPTARIRGDAINLAGGLYRSEQAMIAGTIEDHPLAPYRVIRSDGTVRIQGIQAPAGWELAWPFGLRPPTYDRVDGLTLRWEGSYGARLWRGGRQTVRGSVAYRTERSAPAGGLEIDETRGGTRVAIGARRETDTNDRWIRGDAYNSLTFLTTGRDYRDYFEADRLYATVERDFEGTRIRGSARLRAQLERARSLAASDPWTLFGGEP